jgi:hypothetical protein
MWQRIAAGEFGVHRDDDPEGETLGEWLKAVAKAVLEADALPAGQRPDGLVRAIGLAGRADAYADLRGLVEDPRWQFPVVGEEGKYIEETRAQLVRQMVEVARKQGLLRGVYADDDKKAHELVRDLLTKKR